MLMVTSSVRMVDRVHGHTTGLGPAIPLNLVLVHGTRSLKERLVGSSTTSNDTNHTTGGGGNNLLSTGGEPDTGLPFIRGVPDDGDVVAGGPSKRTTISSLLLNVGGDGTFRHGSKRKDVSDAKRGLFSGIDKLAGVHSLVGNETIPQSKSAANPRTPGGIQGVVRLVAKLVAVRVTEGDLGEGGSSSRVVDDIFHNTTDIAMALTVVEGSEFGRILSRILGSASMVTVFGRPGVQYLSQPGVGSCSMGQHQFSCILINVKFLERTEDRPGTLSLIADDPRYPSSLAYNSKSSSVVAVKVSTCLPIVNSGLLGFEKSVAVAAGVVGLLSLGPRLVEIRGGKFACVYAKPNCVWWGASPKLKSSPNLTSLSIIDHLGGVWPTDYGSKSRFEIRSYQK